MRSAVRAMTVSGASSMILPSWDGSLILGSISRLGHSILAGRPHSTSACVGPFVRGFSPQPHPTSHCIELGHQIQPLEFQMQVPVAKTFEPEVIGFPVLCRLDGVDERPRCVLMVPFPSNPLAIRKKRLKWNSSEKRDWLATSLILRSLLRSNCIAS